jgi:hypothetical protein
MKMRTKLTAGRGPEWMSKVTEETRKGEGNLSVISR